MTKTIKIEIYKDGLCDVNIENVDGSGTITGANTEMQLLGLLFVELITADKKLQKDTLFWVERIHKDHAEVINELMYDKFAEVAEFAKHIKESYYK